MQNARRFERYSERCKLPYQHICTYISKLTKHVRRLNQYETKISEHQNPHLSTPQISPSHSTGSCCDWLHVCHWSPTHELIALCTRMVSHGLQRQTGHVKAAGTGSPKLFRVEGGQQLLRPSSQAPEQEKHVEAPPCLLRVCALSESVA